MRRKQVSGRWHPEIAGALLVAVLCVPGLALSIFLTLIKFRSEYRCDSTWTAACGGEYFDCTRVLYSDWAAPVFKLPISAWSTGYYVVLFGLACAVLWRPARLLEVIRSLILWMAWIGLIVVALLGTYAAVGLRAFCSYCLVVYGITAAIFFAAWLMNPAGHWRGLGALFRRDSSTGSRPDSSKGSRPDSSKGSRPDSSTGSRPDSSTGSRPDLSRRGAVLLLSGLAFVALVSAQMVQYRRNATHLEFDRCIHAGSLPETTLKTAAKRPKAQIALFVDFACGFCRKEFTIWRDFVAKHDAHYRLALYHFARAGECVPPEFGARSVTAEENFSCEAAQAVECAERLQSGAGLQLAEALFALQDQSSPFFTSERLARAAQAAGLGEVPTENFNHPFFQCLRSKETLPHIIDHAVFGMSEGLRGTPVTYLTFYHDEGTELPRMIQTQGAKQYGSIERALASARKTAEARGDAQAQDGGARDD